MLAGQTRRGGDKEGLRLGAVRPRGPTKTPKMLRADAYQPQGRLGRWRRAPRESSAMVLRGRNYVCAWSSSSGRREVR